MTDPSLPPRPVESESEGALPPEQLVAVWKTAVETQMHFNEMSVKSRQFGLTFVVAALGLGIVLLGRGDDFSLAIPPNAPDPLVRVHVTVMIVLGALLGVFGVRQLDLNVYHRMLRGAVAFGEDLEAAHVAKRLGLEKGMTQLVSHYSRHGTAGNRIKADRDTGEDSGTETAEDKLRKFYRILMLSLLAIAVLLFCVTSGIF